MLVDLVWVIAGFVGFMLGLWDRSYLSAFVWLAMAAYAGSHFFNEKLRGSKHDF